MVNSVIQQNEKEGRGMILQCCCICHEDALAAMRGGMEQFTAQTGVGLEAEWFSGPSDLYQRI